MRKGDYIMENSGEEVQLLRKSWKGGGDLITFTSIGIAIWGLRQPVRLGRIHLTVRELVPRIKKLRGQLGPEPQRILVYNLRT